ncbi:MAG: STAS domain-containing protein, partial [Pirellulales bacterium]
RVERSRQGNIWTVRLAGAATFLQLPKLAEALDSVPADVEVRVVCERLRYIDHACLEVLTDWTKRRSQNGAHANVDWEFLQRRSGVREPRPEPLEASEEELVESSSRF